MASDIVQLRTKMKTQGFDQIAFPHLDWAPDAGLDAAFSSPEVRPHYEVLFTLREMLAEALHRHYPDSPLRTNDFSFASEVTERKVFVDVNLRKPEKIEQNSEWRIPRDLNAKMEDLGIAKKVPILSGYSLQQFYLRLDLRDYTPEYNTEETLDERLDRHQKTILMIENGIAPPPPSAFNRKTPDTPPNELLAELNTQLETLHALGCDVLPAELEPILGVSRKGKMVFVTGDEQLDNDLNQRYQTMRDGGFSNKNMDALQAEHHQLQTELLLFHEDAILALDDNDQPLPDHFRPFLALDAEQLGEDAQFLLEIVQKAGTREHASPGAFAARIKAEMNHAAEPNIAPSR